MRRMANNQKKKKKKAGNSISSSCLIPVLDVDDDLVVDQILTRLPVKSLMRFKCICKTWKSIIEHNARFIDLHYAHSQLRLPGLLIVPDCRYIDERSGYELRFFSAELHCNDDDGDCDGGRIITGTTIHRLGRTLKSSRLIYKCLGPVRGLLCLVDSQHAVQIYNVSTGQAVTPWIRSAVVMNRRYRSRKCEFGFDPSTGKHKVVFLWEDPTACEVLTVGVDARWRIIDQVPPFTPQGDISAYVNGSIYWITSTGDMPYGEDDPDIDNYSEFLIAFDVGSEKFRIIRIPRFTFWGYTPFPYRRILEMDGCLTVVRGRRRGPECHTVKMWKFHDYNKLQGINGTSSSTQTERDWSEVTIKLPPYVDVRPEHSNWHSIPGKDLMILEIYNPPGPIRPYDLTRLEFFCFYSYNMINKTLSKIEVQGTSSIPDGRLTRAFFSESLFSVTSELS